MCSADLVTFTEEIFNGKSHFLCSVYQCFQNHDQIYFIKIFYAFVLDNNFFFFEHANQSMHVQTRLTSFIEETAVIWS